MLLVITIMTTFRLLSFLLWSAHIKTNPGSFVIIKSGNLLGFISCFKLSWFCAKDSPLSRTVIWWVVRRVPWRCSRTVFLKVFSWTLTEAGLRWLGMIATVMFSWVFAWILSSKTSHRFDAIIWGWTFISDFGWIMNLLCRW